MKLDAQIEYFSRRSPSHLTGIVSGCGELGLGDGGHGEVIAIGYRLHCTCGHQLFEVTAYLRNPESLIAPVSATCVSCRSHFVVYDSDIHGYDPIACETSSNAHGERDKNAIKTTLASASEPKTVDIVVYYPDDLFDDTFEEFAERRSDLFTWIRIIIGEEVNPSYPLLDFECA